MGRNTWALGLDDAALVGRERRGASFGGGRSDAAQAQIFIDALRRHRADDPDRMIEALDLVCADHLEFVERELRPALRAMSSQWRTRRTIHRGAPRAPVAWSTTAVMRASSRLGPHEFLVTEKSRGAVSPELRVIAAYLRDLQFGVALLARAVGSNRLHHRLLHIDRLTRELANAEPLRAAAELAPDHLDEDAVARSRSFVARRCLARWRYRRRLRRAGKRGVLTSSLLALHANWLEPIADEDLLELYVLDRLLSLIERDFGYGPPRELALFYAAHTHVARFVHDEDEVLLFVDRAAANIFGARSRTGALQHAYQGLGLVEHRPDFVLAWRRKGVLKGGCMFEAKCSDDPDYIRDSVYKAFAYGFDFADIVPRAEGAANLHLVFPASAGVTLRETHPSFLQISSERDDDLRRALTVSSLPKVA